VSPRSPAPRLLHHRGSLVLCGAIAAAWSSIARAQPGSAAKTAVARALYEQAMEEMAAKNYPRACLKLEEVTALAPDMENGLMALAACYERLGRLASAWSLYVHLGAANGAHKREAQRWAKRLEQRLSRLSIAATEAVRALPELVVQCDGVPVVLGPQGTGIPVDKGSHVVAATAKGKQRWETTVVVEADGSVHSVAIPSLRDEPSSEAPPAPPRRPPPIDVDARIGVVVRLGAAPPGVERAGLSGEAAAFVAPSEWVAIGVAYGNATLRETEQAGSGSDRTETDTTRHINSLWVANRLQAPDLGRLRLSLLLSPGVSWQSTSSDVTAYPSGILTPLPACSETDGPNLALRAGIGGDLRLGGGFSLVIDTTVDYVRLSGTPPCKRDPSPGSLLMVGAHSGLAYHFGR
jgi:hypothetical protein